MSAQAQKLKIYEKSSLWMSLVSGSRNYLQSVKCQGGDFFQNFVAFSEYTYRDPKQNFKVSFAL